MKSWQTTVAGLGCIAGGVYLIAAQKGAIEGAGLIAAGLGLVRAKDANVNSTLGQVQEATIKENQAALKASNNA